MTARRLSPAERRRLHAPELDKALERHAPHTDAAAGALDDARAFVAKVNEGLLEGDDIVFALAELIFRGRVWERREMPKREARAASAALLGAKALLGLLGTRLQGMADEHDRRADQS